MFKFEKETLASAKGRQPSKYDCLMEHFVNEGDTLFFDESEVGRQTASNIARRLTNIGEGKKFHSFCCTIKKKVAVRLRPESELVTDTEAEGEGEEE